MLTPHLAFVADPQNFYNQWFMTSSFYFFIAFLNIFRLFTDVLLLYCVSCTLSCQLLELLLLRRAERVLHCSKFRENWIYCRCFEVFGILCVTSNPFLNFKICLCIIWDVLFYKWRQDIWMINVLFSNLKSWFNHWFLIVSSAK